MATPSEVGAEVAVSMNAASQAVKTSARKALSEIGEQARQELEQAARRPVPSGRLRNHGGASFSVTVTEGDNEIDVIPRGPWGILEPGAQAHSITARRPMPGPNGPRWGPFRHPGTPDTGAWSQGFETTTSAAERIFPDIVGDAVESAFG